MEKMCLSFCMFCKLLNIPLLICIRVPGLKHIQSENDHFKKYSGGIKEHKFKTNIHFLPLVD